MNGKLIVIMGIDGSGKTTLLENLQNCCLNNENIKFMRIFKKSKYTKELESISKQNNKPLNKCFSKKMRSLAWRADIIDNMFKYVIPELEKGKIVVIDRYFLCNKVIHSIRNNEFSGADKIMEILPKPDLGIYLNVDADTALDRINKRGEDKSFHENKEDLLKMKQLYDEFIKEETYPIITIDANKSEKEVLKKAADSIIEVLKEDERGKEDELFK